ncbi:MAG: hypothetical protein HQM16_16545 [Deltaproteobacteria bacterium]|nr:hypothetical protein [Deltaproteobacteria bacterium]
MSRLQSRQKREVVVVPNLSYGYLPVVAIIDELQALGIGSIIGVKVGSTESHNNREVMNSRLFKGNRTEISNEQPVIIVVDGTYNLVVSNNRNRTARYPDAHQGYLNHVIALNDAMGFLDVDYSKVGKDPEDIERLRSAPEFQRAVEVYKGVLKDGETREPYQFQMWNTAEMNLAIRGGRQVLQEVVPYDGEVKGPAMIFANVGVLDEQIPDKIREGYGGMVHKPAQFDDSGLIINFDFGYDEYGVRYLNRLETEVKKAYNRITGSDVTRPDNVDLNTVPALIRSLRFYVAEEEEVGVGAH